MCVFYSLPLVLVSGLQLAILRIYSWSCVQGSLLVGLMTNRFSKVSCGQVKCLAWYTISSAPKFISKWPQSREWSMEISSLRGEWECVILRFVYGCFFFQPLFKGVTMKTWVAAGCALGRMRDLGANTIMKEMERV